MRRLPDTGHVLASGTWPGGQTYGRHEVRRMIARVWTDEEVVLAYRHGITLPRAGMATITAWWDQPVDTVIESEPSGDPLMTEDLPTLRVTCARKYARIEFDYDPLRGLRQQGSCD